MAVAFSSSVNSGESSTAAVSTPSITVSGTNPVIVIGISQPVNGTVSSVTFGGTGTPTRIIRVLVSTFGFSEIWAIPAPSGSGAITVNFSAAQAGAYVIACLFTGADQTTPCPVGDAQSVADTAANASLTLTPTNLTANDASVGMVGLFNSGDVASPWVQNNDIFHNLGGTADAEIGYSLGTASVTGNWVNTASNKAFTAARIKVASSGSVVFEDDRFQPPPLVITVPSIQAFRDAEDVPTLHGQYDEDFWVNPTAPTIGTLYQRLPIGDPEELPAADLTATVDEYFWLNPVFPVAGSLGPIYLPDPEEIPAASLTATVDEYLWQNPTAPVIGTFLRLNPWVDDQTPQFVVLFQPDEDFWLNPVPLSVLRFTSFSQLNLDSDYVSSIRVKFVPWVQEDDS